MPLTRKMLSLSNKAPRCDMSGLGVSVVILVWILVAFTSTFNYNSNILDPFWFSVTFSFLGAEKSFFLSHVKNTACGSIFLTF